MKCLVTGGAGFIGSNLVDQLVKLGHQVIVLDNLSTGRFSNLNKVKNKIKFVHVDVSKNKNSFSKYFYKVDWVFHLAGLADIIPSIKNPEPFFKTNVGGTKNVLEISQKFKIKKLIYAASASCYGIPSKYPTNEKSKIDPQNPYAVTKYLGEQLALNWHKLYKLPTVSLRFFNAYGPRSRKRGAYNSVIGIFLTQKILGKPFTVIGNGKQTRDFIYISDLVDAVIKAAQKGKTGEIYNVGYGKEISINKIAKIIGNKKIFLKKRPGEPKRSLADIRKIKKHFDWKPKVKIDEGLKNLIKDIKIWKRANLWTAKKIETATKILYKK